MNVNYKTTQKTEGFQELIYSDNNINITIQNKQRNNTRNKINYKLKVYKIDIDSIVKIKTIREAEEDGELIWTPCYRDVKIVNIDQKDKYGNIYQGETQGNLKSKVWFGEENIVEVIK